MKILRPLVLLIPLVLFSCGLNNTMYNARKYFKSAQDRPLNANGRPSSQAVDEYTKAIKKCGIILSQKNTSRNTDDALFLMARALYYKGNSAFQAKDQFENLIKGFPDSRYYGEAHIYLAKVLRDINRPEDARALLEQFIRDPNQIKLHPRALLTLAEFNIADKDYNGAQYWLRKIIDGYPKAKEYKEAFLLFGKNYYVQKDYVSSLQEFEKITQSRLIPKLLKLEAQYYVALNQFQLGQYDKSWRNVQKLLNDDSRPEQLSQIRVLQARLLFARDEAEKGIAESDQISKDYPRTQSSAEAQFNLGEYYFYQAGDLDKAATAYNRVRTEFPTSTFSELSQQKATAITQLKQNANLNAEQNLQEYVDYHITAAENYLNSFALPDSALLMYQRIIDARDSLRAERDSLSASVLLHHAEIDSLNSQISLLPEPPAPDSLAAPDSLKTQALPAESDTLAISDSLQTINEPREELPAVADSLDLSLIPEEEGTPAPSDSLDLSLKPEEEGSSAPPDSLAQATQVEKEPDPAEQRRSLEQRLSTVQSQLKAAEESLANLEEILARFDNELVPLSLFSQASIYSKAESDSLRVLALFEKMQTDFPGNKYTKALGAMINGDTIRLIDPLQESQEISLDRAFGLFETQPDSMAVILDSLAASTYSDIRLKSNFRLGWFYTFEQPDTLRAKPYLEEVLKLQKSGDYASLTTRFFDGSRFKLNRFEELVDSLAAAKAKADSLKLLAEQQKALADSLAALADTTAAADSLKHSAAPPEAPPEEDKPELRDELPPDSGSPDVPEKKEEPPSLSYPGAPPPEDTIPPPLH